MSKGKKIELQTLVHNQDQWDDLLQKEGLIVVDAYAGWCGPCKAVVSTLKRIKNEIGDNLLHFATAETDHIESLAMYRGKSRPTFLFFANKTLVCVIRGCNCPVITKTIKNQLEREHKVLDGKFERIEFVDEEVKTENGAQEEKETKEEIEEEDDDTEVKKEVSLAIIKPDAVKAGLVDEIIAKVEAEGMEILRKEERVLTKEEAANFYKQHEGSDHFEDLVEFMSSGPCMTLIIQGKEESGTGIIPQIRDLIGPKDIELAKEQAPTSIRALYGTSSLMNAVHACDTSESAARELAFFYPDFVSPTKKEKKNKRPSSRRTLALIRPDALRHHKQSIIDKIKEAGFSIAMAKELTLTREEAEDFYSEHKGKDFFEPLVNNMCSGPVMALCLAKEDAIEGWRNMLGPKELHIASEEAPESLRAQFKVDNSDINPLHGSDSAQAADREIQKLFPVETTVAVIKPETATQSADEIIDKIHESGFKIISRKDVGLTKELASQFYSEHAGKDFYDGLTDYMSSGQSTVLLLEREDAVTGWRAMMGPTDPGEARETAPDSIRAVYGKDIVRNAVHGSSDKTKASKVIEELFPDVELLPDGHARVRGPSEDLKQSSDIYETNKDETEEAKDDIKEQGTTEVTVTDDGEMKEGTEHESTKKDIEETKEPEGSAQEQSTNKDIGEEHSTNIDGGEESTNKDGEEETTNKDGGESTNKDGAQEESTNKDGAQEESTNKDGAQEESTNKDGSEVQSTTNNGDTKKDIVDDKEGSSNQDVGETEVVPTGNEVTTPKPEGDTNATKTTNDIENG